MEVKEAIARIKEHKEIHFAKEYPFAIKITEALELAIKALEKQIPIKPREVGWRVSMDSDIVYEYYCPKCSEKVYKPNPKRYKSGDKYCCKCGQSLNWGE